MKPGAWLFLALVCTSGCRNLGLSTIFPQAEAPAAAEQTIVKLKNPVPEDTPPANPQIGEAFRNVQPEVGNPPRIEKQNRPAMVVAEASRSTTGALRRDIIAQSPQSSLSKPKDSEKSQAVARANVSAAPEITSRDAEKKDKAVELPASQVYSDAMSQGLSKEAWYGIGTICGALFTSILAPLLVDLIKHCLGFGSAAHHSRYRNAPRMMM